ncbi:hypothetical protein B4900_08565 [Yersinia rohdei]|nr:hypothetical protein B4900_08565 [Yersinia rohdei]
MLGGGFLGIFKRNRQCCCIFFGFFQCLPGHGQLGAGLAETINLRRLHIKGFEAVLCVANITGKGFTRSLNRFKRAGGLVYRFEQYL